MEFKRVFDETIIIAPCENGGLIVTVGCSKRTYNGQDWRSLITDLEQYIINPTGVTENRREALCGRGLEAPQIHVNPTGGQ